MSVETILQTIENEIANLTQARNVLASLNGSSSKAAEGQQRTILCRFTGKDGCRPEGPLGEVPCEQRSNPDRQACSHYERIRTPKDCCSPESQMGKTQDRQESCLDQVRAR